VKEIFDFFSMLAHIFICVKNKDKNNDVSWLENRDGYS